MTRVSPEVYAHWLKMGYDARQAGKDLWDYPQRIAAEIGRYLPTPTDLIDAWKDGWKKAELEAMAARATGGDRFA